MSYYDTDYFLLIWRQIPTELRDEVLYEWLKALCVPVVTLNGAFLTNRNNNLYRLAHNSQVPYLTAALNDVFDPVDRGIYLTDGPVNLALYEYQDAEEQPVWLGLVSEEGSTPYPDPETLYLDSETVGGGFQFIVNVPVAVESLPNYNEAWMRSVVNEYRLASRGNYEVVYF